MPDDQYFMLRYEVAEMKHKLATSDLLREAETMGFEITIDLPKDSLIPLPTNKNLWYNDFN